jgi:hypothetical protein
MVVPGILVTLVSRASNNDPERRCEVLVDVAFAGVRREPQRVQSAQLLERAIECSAEGIASGLFRAADNGVANG